MVIACDFDDTLCDSRNVLQGYRMGQPTDGAVIYTKKLVEMGHEIIIFTARSVNKPEVYKAVEDWLKYFGIPHHGITNIKQPYFDVMVDNRSIAFTGSWTGMLTRIEKFDTTKA